MSYDSRLQTLILVSRVIMKIYLEKAKKKKTSSDLRRELPVKNSTSKKPSGGNFFLLES